MRKYPEKYLPIQTEERHRKFIQSLPCARCSLAWKNDKPVKSWTLEGDWKLSIPLCLSCIDGIMGGWEQIDRDAARSLAHKINLYSGDFYSVAMIINREKEKVFI